MLAFLDTNSKGMTKERRKKGGREGRKGKEKKYKLLGSRDSMKIALVFRAFAPHEALSSIPSIVKHKYKRHLLVTDISATWSWAGSSKTSRT